MGQGPIIITARAKTTCTLTATPLAMKSPSTGTVATLAISNAEAGVEIGVALGADDLEALLAAGARILADAARGDARP